LSYTPFDSTPTQREPMTVAVDIEDADLAQLIHEVEAGAEIVITKAGEPVARIVSAQPEQPKGRVPGSAKGLFRVPDDFDAPLDDFKDYM
jgi:antitoxin (DNA-binding transcriptional repressor) of toxin-antitoxin stability system